VKDNTLNQVVITGASGFIGSNLLSHTKFYPDFKLIPVSRKKLPNYVFVENYKSSPKSDILIYLSEDSNSNIISKDTDHYLNNNKNTLSELLQKNYSKLIYVSSAAIYGDQNNFSNNIKTNVINDSLYTNLKFQSEKIVLEHPNGIVVRLSNVYGPGMSKKNVISTIIDQSPGDGDLLIKSSSPIRDFVWVTDVVDGIMKLANLSADQITRHKLFNIGTDVGSSIADSAKIALEVAKQDHRQITPTESSRNFSKIVVDYSCINSQTGWQPKVDILSGLTNLIMNKIKGI
jgi:UDP-glucose 4-epimerase